MKSFQQWVEYLGKKQSRPVGNNTRVEQRGENIAIRLHATDVVTLRPDGAVVLNTDGWKTSTTKDRINSYSPVRICQAKGIWSFTSGGKTHLFADGVTILPDGTVEGAATPTEEASNKALRKQIDTFAKLCASKVPLPHPGAGDCLFCGMVVAGTKTPLGEATKNTDHLVLHMEEGYAVPSLVAQALTFGGNTPFILASAFNAGGMTDLAKERVQRSVKKYMLRQFGLA